MSPLSPAPLALGPVPAPAEAFAPRTPDPLPSAATPRADWSDLELTRAIRAGDMPAAGELYTRHHGYAVRVAARLSNPNLADDLASEAMTKVVAALLNGHGPDTAVRAYLVTTIRNLLADRLRKHHGEVLVDPRGQALDRAEEDATGRALERLVVLDVLAELPERWREVLWRTVVLEQPLSVVGASMGLSPSATAALGYRARIALTRAYARAAATEAA